MIKMSKELMWSFLVHLGESMWGDYPPGDGGKCINTNPVRFHEPTWHDISKRLKDEGCCNTSSRLLSLKVLYHF